MRPFEYIKPETLDGALAALSKGEGARILAGGTDLLGEMKRGVNAPQQLVNLKSVPGLNGLRLEPDGALVIGALARLDEIAENPLAAEHCPMLMQAIQRTATPQIRNLGTLGGNLCQRPRCWYYRHPDFPCVRKHGEGCFAVGGQDRYHAIFGGYRCFMVHPSDTAPALIALDAQAKIAHADGARTVPLGDFFVGPRESLTQETVLGPGEILTEVRIPAPPPGARGIYLKVSERKAADFALVSVAAYVAQEGTEVTHARIVLGGVAPIPWRAPNAEACLLDGGLSDEAIRRACEAAVEGAQPMGQNAYKAPLVSGLLGKALRSL